MVYQEIQNFNVTGLDDLLVYTSTILPIFMPMMLIFLWLLVTLTVYFGTRKFAGQGDFFAATASAGFLTVVIGMILSLTAGIINIPTIIIIIAIAIISFVLLFIRRNRD